MRDAISAAVAAILAISAATSLAGETRIADDPVCDRPAPLREVAQDEIYTFEEQCSMRRDFVRPEHRRAPDGIGWAKTLDARPPRKN